MPSHLRLLFFKDIYLFLATLCGMWDFSSLTRDRIWGPLQWRHRVLTTGSPGKSPDQCCWETRVGAGHRGAREDLGRMMELSYTLISERHRTLL